MPDTGRVCEKPVETLAAADVHAQAAAPQLLEQSTGTVAVAAPRCSRSGQGLHFRGYAVPESIVGRQLAGWFRAEPLPGEGAQIELFSMPAPEFRTSASGYEPAATSSCLWLLKSRQATPCVNAEIDDFLS